MRSHHRLLVVLLVASGFAARAAASVPAGDDDVIDRAEALFQDGKRLLERGDAHAACPKLAESLRLDRATGTLLALAMCHEADGQLASARAEYLEVVARANKEGRPDREEAARQYARALEVRLSAADHQPVGGSWTTSDQREAAGAPGAEAADLSAQAGAHPSRSPGGAPRFTAAVTAALAASDAGAAAAAELALANGAGWGGALRGACPASGRTEPIAGGGAVSLRSFALRGWMFRRFRPDRVFSAQVGPEILWQLDRADSVGLAGGQATWRAGWGVGIGGGLDLPVARWMSIAVLASVDYAPAGWTGSLAVANHGDVLQPNLLRVLVAAGPRFGVDW